MSGCSVPVGCFTSGFGISKRFQCPFLSSKSIIAKPERLKCFVNPRLNPWTRSAPLSQRQGETWPALCVVLPAFQTLYTERFSASQAVSLSASVLNVLKLLLRSVCQTSRQPSGKVMGLSPCFGRLRGRKGQWDATFWPPRVSSSCRDLELSRTSEYVCMKCLLPLDSSTDILKGGLCLFYFKSVLSGI